MARGSAASANSGIGGSPARCPLCRENRFQAIGIDGSHRALNPTGISIRRDRRDSAISGESEEGEKRIFKSLLVFEEEFLPDIKPVWSGLISFDMVGD